MSNLKKYKLTRRQLHDICLSLPHPSLVINGKIDPVIKIPFYDSTQKLIDDHGDTFEIRELTFTFSYDQLDWVLDELDTVTKTIM